MDNKDILNRFILGLIVIMVLFSIALNKPHDYIEPDQISKISNVDSLQSVINNLQVELETQEKGFSNKEQRYEDILFEYEYGLERLKETHPSAYKEFHRIIAFKERYSVEDKIDNQKRLKSYEQLR